MKKKRSLWISHYSRGIHLKWQATLIILAVATYFTTAFAEGAFNEKYIASKEAGSTTGEKVHTTTNENKAVEKKQENIVTGKVVDGTGTPIIGASVIIKGTTTGTVTDTDGNYELHNVVEGDHLICSFIGFVEKDLTVGEQSVIDFKLEEDVLGLEEIIVIGYGVQKKSNVTGAITQLKAEDMENRTISNPLQAISGKTAGAQVFSNSAAPGSSPTINIRGVNSNGSSSPLYVVDGRVADNISGIDPNDIQSMEILKDAASAAIYGAQAGNGVILITTKKGKAGEGKVTYDLQITTQSLSNIPKVMNSEQFIDYWVEAGKFTMDKVYKYWDFNQNTDWVNEIFEPSLMKRHTLGFQGGNDKGGYYLSGSVLDDNGMVIGDADVYKRYTGMINTSYNIKPWLEVGTNNQIEYYKSRSVSEGSEYSSLILSTLQMDPMTAVTYTEDNMPDNMTAILENYNETGVGELLSDGNGNYYGVSPYLSSENVNPLIMRDKTYSKTTGFNINGTAYMNLKPSFIKGLVATSRFSYLLSAIETYGYSNDYYANSSSYQNFVSVNASTYASSRYQWENFVNYTKTIGKHNLTAMLGTSFTQSRTYGLYGSITGSDSTLGVEQDNPLYYYLDYATGEATQSVSGGEPILHAQNAYFGRLAYSFSDKYLAEFVMRADAFDSGYLPEDNRWGYFPGGSIGWVISKESFMDGTREFINNLKIRASWGQNGSVAALAEDNYMYATSVTSTGSYPYGSDATYTIGYTPAATGNDELKWETHEQADIGLDARFLDNRLSIVFDYYSKKTKDLIIASYTPSTIVGNDVSPINAGNMLNKGIEFEAGWQDKRGDFYYDIRGNFTTISNEVTGIHESVDYISGASFHSTTGITRFEVGKPAWYFSGYEFDGIDETTGDPTFVDQDDDGSINANDKVEIGKGTADFFYGITIDLAYKGFDFVAFGQGSYGNDIYNCINRTDYAVNKLTYFTDDRWTEDNTSGHNPRAGANDLSKYYTSSAVVLDGSYFKIKQIQLGYTLPERVLEKIKFQNLRIYGSLENYFTFTKYIGFDPEVTGYIDSDTGNYDGSSIGVDKGGYPTSKKIIFGLNVSF